MEWLNSDEICSDIVLDVLESRGQSLAFSKEPRGHSKGFSFSFPSTKYFHPASLSSWTLLNVYTSFNRVKFNTMPLGASYRGRNTCPLHDPPYISLDELLPDCEWPQLQALSLTGVPFHERELWKIVDRIRSSLKILDMDGLQILNGSWRNAYRILRGLDNLEEVSCRWPPGGEYGTGSYEDDLVFRFSENAVCQYLLKVKDAENPFG
ncbi:hypothetical protein BDFG_00797 [Blastomyces dermatitidis ATCC 26199]|nr:hypothetical protein BDFG_00797 [Blastomyces dermatitidis ATCC 26199]